MPKKLSMRSNGRILGRKSESQKGAFLRQSCFPGSPKIGPQIH
jgi:hypothetical protein